MAVQRRIAWCRNVSIVIETPNAGQSRAGSNGFNQAAENSHFLEFLFRNSDIFNVHRQWSRYAKSTGMLRV